MYLPADEADESIFVNQVALVIEQEPNIWSPTSVESKYKMEENNKPETEKADSYEDADKKSPSFVVKGNYSEGNHSNSITNYSFSRFKTIFLF